MLGHGYWQRRFGGDPGVLERALTIDGRPHQIVGVMPADFRFGGEFEIVLPLRIDRGAPIPSFRLLGVARLNPGVTPAQADADVMRVLHVWFERSGVKPEVRAAVGAGAAAARTGRRRRRRPDALGPDGGDRRRPAPGLRQRRQPAAGARRGAPSGAGDSRRAGCQLAAPDRPAPGREPAAGAGGRRARGRPRATSACARWSPSARRTCPGCTRSRSIRSVLGFALVVALLSGLLFGLIPILRHATPRIVDAVGGRGASLTREQQRAQQVLVAGADWRWRWCCWSAPD